MAIFTEDQRHQILLALGYSPEDLSAFNQMDDDKPSVTVNSVLDWLTELTEIDADLKVARSRSMAVEAEDIKLDYAQHITALRLRGREIVQQISRAIGIPVAWNRFAGNKGSSTIVSVM